MKLDKRSLNASPFVGVFGILTDKVLLVPHNIQPKEEKGLAELTGAEVIKASIASSPLLGVLGIASGKKIALSEIALDSELKELESAGFKAMRLEGVTALGNLACFTEKGGIVSPVLSEKQSAALSEFFGVKAKTSKVAGLDITGASVAASKKGFIAHPKTSAGEMKALEKAFRAGGILTTANYGDRFVGNSVLANSSSAIAGINTTGHELIRIEDAFYG